MAVNCIRVVSYNYCPWACGELALDSRLDLTEGGGETDLPDEVKVIAGPERACPDYGPTGLPKGIGQTCGGCAAVIVTAQWFKPAQEV